MRVAPFATSWVPPSDFQRRCHATVSWVVGAFQIKLEKMCWSRSKPRRFPSFTFQRRCHDAAVMVKRNMNSGHHFVTSGFVCLSSLPILYLFARIAIGSKDLHAKYFFWFQIFMKFSKNKLKICLFSKLTLSLLSQIHPRPRGWPLPWAPELSRNDVYWHRLPDMKNGETEMKKTQKNKLKKLWRLISFWVFFVLIKFFWKIHKDTVYLGVLVVWNWYQKP